MKKLKVGDKVTIRSKAWYNKHKDESGEVQDVPFGFVLGMAEFCGKTAKVIAIRPPKYDDPADYSLNIDSGFWSWSEEMFQKQKTTKK